MSIIENEQTVAEEVKAHKKAVNAFYKMIASRFIMIGNDFWQNPRFTPEEMAVEYGAELGDLFRLSTIMGQTIYQATGIVINQIPPGYNAVPNPDGTVTVSKLPDPSPPPMIDSSSSDFESSMSSESDPSD